MSDGIKVTEAMVDHLLDPDNPAFQAGALGYGHEKLMEIASSDPLSGCLARCFSNGVRDAIVAANRDLRKITIPLTKLEVVRLFNNLAVSKEQLREWQQSGMGMDYNPWIKAQELRLYSAGWAHGKQLAWSTVYGMLVIYQKVEDTAKKILEAALSAKITDTLVLELEEESLWRVASTDGHYQVMFNVQLYRFTATDKQTEHGRAGIVHSFGSGNGYIILDPIPCKAKP